MVINPATWKKVLPQLTGIDLTEDESMALFNKYDSDGSGEIDMNEFIESILSSDFPKRGKEIERVKILTLDADGEGPKVSVPPGFCGHMPGSAHRYGISFGTSALKAWTTKEAKNPGPFREVSVPLSVSQAGSFPGHVLNIVNIKTKAGIYGRWR